jgi:UDP-N-acetyl-D-glucosamine dehydrogenase
VSLKNRIKEKRAKIGIIGLGYVGLPLAVEFARAGFSVVGIDSDKKKVKKINKGESYISDVRESALKPLVKKGRLKATGDYRVLEEIEVVNICVPTPVTKSKEPDISYITSAARGIAKFLRPERLVILRSTTYPGTTEEVVLPILGSSGLKVGRDFYLSFSPERVDPGNKKWTIKNTPLIVGGVTPQCTQLSKELFAKIAEKVITVSSPRVGEMEKLLENIFRGVNIALVNELAQLSDRMGINIWEVVEAASTKPFGFMSFKPGPGVGGHCIPCDPFYLSWKAREYDFYTNFITLAAETNENMPYYVLSKIISALSEKSKGISGSRVLVLGVAFKKDINDSRYSPSLKVIELLEEKGAKVFYNDPYIPVLKRKNKVLKSSPLTKNLLKNMDCAVILTDHTSYNYSWIVRSSKLVVDTRNATRNVKGKVVKI